MKEPPQQPQPAPALSYFHIPLPEYSLLYPNNFTGIKQESISSAAINSGYLTTLLETRDVKAAFVGHDHINDFCGDVSGKITRMSTSIHMTLAIGIHNQKGKPENQSEPPSPAPWFLSNITRTIYMRAW